MPHTIHLRDHWTVTPLTGGLVRQARSFGSPLTLDPGETVWLVGTAPGSATVSVNDEVVGAIAAAGRFEIKIKTTLMPRNRVWFDVLGGIVTDIALEFRPN
ncbi:hypothetical protein BH11PLA2_BH11PLA2_05130 [soil metagenome]